MIEFSILKQSRKSRARLGVLKTPNGTIETPALVPVATQAAVKTLTAEAAATTGSQVLICNTFHLHLRPGEKIVRHAGGLHRFMNWQRPLMTDSGGFQVFSLGFGRDQNVGKVLKYFPGQKAREKLKKKAQPHSVKISSDGVFFRSPLNGSKLFLGPRESMRIQRDLGADIIFAFDECTSPLASKEYIIESLERTHRWAETCIREHSGRQALFGIVQGSHFRQLREDSARFISKLDFDGYGIGGDLGETKKDMDNILAWTVPHLDPRLPRHLLGVGYLEDMERIMRGGADLFDCTVPTHYARRGVAFTSRGRLNLNLSAAMRDKRPVDRLCRCEACAGYTRQYIAHLLKAREMTAMSLLTVHNLTYFNAYVAALREKIRQGKL